MERTETELIEFGKFGNIFIGDSFMDLFKRQLYDFLHFTNPYNYIIVFGFLLLILFGININRKGVMIEVLNAVLLSGSIIMIAASIVSMGLIYTSLNFIYCAVVETIIAVIYVIFGG